MMSAMTRFWRRWRRPARRALAWLILSPFIAVGLPVLLLMVLVVLVASPVMWAYEEVACSP